MIGSSALRKSIIISFCFAVVLILLIFIIIIPFFGDVEYYSGQVLEKKKELALLKSEIEFLESSERKQLEVASDIEKTKSFYVDKDAPINFISFLERTAGSAGLDINISAVDSSKSQTLGFNLFLKGNLLSSLKFLNKIESGPYLLEIQSLNLKKNQEKKLINGKYVDLNEVDMNIKIIVYSNEEG
ncbi:MAG: hypothetical protein A2365_02665 [Candidatus Nealsonbacteria bacterium RIFOXYB1_FULL_40_15]|uniref:Uncharacterized protein n=2 Tax=Candidatus Nealsoniibacteriota TaxID=1817911 RepID=A0A1G2EQ80_9BACT|nr:MAG: hypothetical protein A2365_02665 [Candidatus Nealsonbacteria bacterium RIFOXYB1_FULL_40_15]OGZ27500.1 MAG: hypothetical protein A2427_01520 [Candidatus Nealsonbacteria bacterium RIFOXYC1_FULL_40_7]OGZ28156.1 MAG: hypothetical protein A2562_02925 [Candidatus Nealsonbacteria bacterium RIFOXYD1_FULL_39_11]